MGCPIKPNNFMFNVSVFLDMFVPVRQPARLATASASQVPHTRLDQTIFYFISIISYEVIYYILLSYSTRLD